MPAPHNYDFRCQAIEAVKQGERKTKVAKMFNISRNTLDLWLKRVESTGDCHPKPRGQRNPWRKIKDPEQFEAFVQLHSHKTQAEMARLWGEGVTQQNISDALKRIGWSRKKADRDGRLM